ncbi:MAG: histone deacetylase [Thermoanaerobaculaceae bacterium]|nr:histone deacetylase [Thermoanaerobaculaceae bacterium]TAM44309.1 MAG: histone deacetylase [Acidobacteriota bacterium]
MEQGKGERAPGGLRRAVRRQWRRLRYAAHPPAVRFIYDPAYERNLTGVPLDPLRADRILAFLVDERLIRREEISAPQPAALKNVLLVHAPEYLEALQRPETLTRILGLEVSEDELDQVLDLQRLMAGGTIQATRWALAARCAAINLGGGFHHAGRRGGMGFCVFNDVAVAIARLRQRGFSERVLVVDLDLHDGNGTREIFAADQTVHTFSVHNEHWGDTAAVASTSIALGGGVGDELYLGTLLKSLPGVFESFRPGLVVYVAGCDVAEDDAIGNWKVTADGIFARDRFVVDLVRRHGARLVVVLGGGYGDASWRHHARFLAWLLTGSAIEPPDNEELTLMRFRQIKATLDPVRLTSTSGHGGWELTEDDLVGILPGVPRHTRFLEYFSKVGIELLLERFGILQQLRARGFKAPVVHLELEHPLGQTLKIFGGPDRRELLVELRVHRSARAVIGCEVLEVEWLLLQNPREPFSGSRAPLPGQQHPGLGMLREIFGWLVVVSETLALDGIVFRPSHYHVAALSHRYTRFLDPAAEALMRALERVLAEVPLEPASRAVEEGRVVRATTGEPVRWEGWMLALAATDRLRVRTEGETYEAAVSAAATDLRLQPDDGAGT